MGNLGSLIAQAFPGKPRWTAKNMPDLSGQVVIVTGGNTGIGKETVKELLKHNAKVYLAARSQSKAENAIRDLKEETGREAIFLKLDLADLKAVKAAAEEYITKEKELHVLFNNGGVMALPVEQVTADGYDMQFGVNVLGHFYFTMLLLPTLLATAKTSRDGHARVITTSSSAMYLTSGLDFNALKDGPARRKYHTSRLYAKSKLGNVLFANELARLYGDQGVLSVSLNPGNIRSDLQRYLGGVQAWIIDKILYPTEYGPISQLWAGTAPEALSAQGKFIVPWAKVGKGTDDPVLAKELWVWMQEQVKDI